MAKGGELWIGLTDFPIFLEALILTFLIKKNGNADKKRWFTDFLMIAAGALLGTIVHCVSLSTAASRKIWVILYVFPYSMVYLFFVLMIEKMKGGILPPAWFRAGVACYAVSCLLLMLGSDADIFVFIGYAAVLAAAIVRECIRQGRRAGRENLVMILLGLAIVGQCLSIFIGSIGVIMGHILVVTALFFLYEVAKEPASDRNV